MVAPAFGFSIGDFITGIKLLIDVCSAVKEADGVTCKYATEVAFLNSLTSTLTLLENFAITNSTSEEVLDLTTLLQSVQAPLKDFANFLEKYKTSLGTSSTKSKFRKAPKIISYTVDNVTGKVGKLKGQIDQPIQTIQLLLLLHILTKVNEHHEEPLQPQQCAQIVTAISAADVPAKLDEQINALQKAVRESTLKQDSHIQLAQESNAGLYGLILKTRDELSAFRRVMAAADLTTRELQKGQLQSAFTVQSDVQRLSKTLQNDTYDLKAALARLVGKLEALQASVHNVRALEEASLLRPVETSNEIAMSASTSTVVDLVMAVLQPVASGLVAASIIHRAYSQARTGLPFPIPFGDTLPRHAGPVPRTCRDPSAVDAFSPENMGVLSQLETMGWITDFTASNNEIHHDSNGTDHPGMATGHGLSQWAGDFTRFDSSACPSIKGDQGHPVFTCPHCDSFSGSHRYADLRRHVERKHEPRKKKSEVYTCLQKDCRKTYNSRAEYESHYERRHTDKVCPIDGMQYQDCRHPKPAFSDGSTVHYRNKKLKVTARRLSSLDQHRWEYRISKTSWLTAFEEWPAHDLWLQEDDMEQSAKDHDTDTWYCMECASLNSALCSSCPVCGWSSQ